MTPAGRCLKWAPSPSNHLLDAPPQLLPSTDDGVGDFRRYAPRVITSAMDLLVAHTSIDFSAAGSTSGPKRGAVATIATPRYDSALPVVCLVYNSSFHLRPSIARALTTHGWDS